MVCAPSGKRVHLTRPASLIALLIASVILLHGPTRSVFAQNCRMFDDNCVTCTASRCTGCLDTLFLQGSSCVVTCDTPDENDQAYFVQNGECFQCHPTCASCTGSGASDCIKCHVDAGFLYQGRCVQECPISTFEAGSPEDVTGVRCEECATGCGRCDETLCLACVSGLYLQSTACVQASACALGTGPVDGTEAGLGGVCAQCNDTMNCERCSGSGPSDCTVCANGTLLEEGRCVAQCSTGYAYNTQSSQCRPCGEFIEHCSTCTAQGETCTLCENDYFYNTAQRTCDPTTQCNAFEQATVAATTTSDRLCLSCTVCTMADTYSFTGCETLVANLQCEACITVCPTRYTVLEGICGPLSTSMCTRPEATHVPPSGFAYVDVTLRLSNLQGVDAATLLASGTTNVEGQTAPIEEIVVDAVLAAVPFVSANPKRAIGAFAPEEVSTSAVSVVVRLSTPSSDIAAAVLALEAIGSGQTADAFKSALPTMPGVFAQVEVAVLTTDFEETDLIVSNLHITNSTSRTLSIAWDPVSQEQAALMSLGNERRRRREEEASSVQYVVFTALSNTANAKSTITTETALDIRTSELGAGDVVISVGVLTQRDNAVGPMSHAQTSVPSCGSDCLECTASTCLTCNSTTEDPLVASSSSNGCVSAARSGDCVSFGASEVCGTPFYLFLCGCIVLVFIIFAAFYFWYTRRAVRAVDDAKDWSLYRIKQTKHVPRWLQLPDEQKQALNQSRPYRGEQLMVLQKEGMNLLDEYASVPQNNAFIDEVPSSCMDKNRFVSLLPNLHTRVVLSSKPHAPVGSDYINASFIRSYDQSRDDEYIITQAPTESTIEDLLHLVWDRQVSTIVMMCRLVEDGALVCPRYFPTRSKWHQIVAPTSQGPVKTKARVLTFGRFTLQLVKEVESEVFTIAKFKLRNGTLRARTLSHISYHLWPSVVKPPPAIGLVSLIEAVGTLRKNDGTPLLIHCTSGIDRAAVYVLGDMAMKMYKRTRQVDLLKLFCNMRQDRGSTISSADLYSFVYRVAAAFVRMFENSPHALPAPQSSLMVKNPAFGMNDAGDESDGLSSVSSNSRGPAARKESAWEVEMSLSEDESEDGDGESNKRERQRASAQMVWQRNAEAADRQRQSERDARRTKKEKRKAKKQQKKDRKAKKKEKRRQKQQKVRETLKQLKKKRDAEEGYLDMSVGTSSSDDSNDSLSDMEQGGGVVAWSDSDDDADSLSDGVSVGGGDASEDSNSDSDSDSDAVDAHLVVPVFEPSQPRDVASPRGMRGSGDALDGVSYASRDVGDDGDSDMTKSRILNAIMIHNRK